MAALEGVRGAEIAPHGDVREVTNVVDKPPEAGIIEWPVLRHSRSVAHCLLDRAKPNLRVCYYGGACRVTRRTQPQCGIRCREFAEYRRRGTNLRAELPPNLAQAPEPGESHGPLERGGQQRPRGARGDKGTKLKRCVEDGALHARKARKMEAPLESRGIPRN